MPEHDRKGPDGQGPLTGRGIGPCREGVVGYRGRRPFRKGFGFRRSQNELPLSETKDLTEKEEKKLLENELQLLKEEMQDIEKRLKEIK